MKHTFLLLLITSSICFGQTKYDEYDKLISEANHYRGIEDFGQAIIKYNEALEILTPNSSTPFFNLAECALHFENSTLADEWIRKGVSRGGAQIDYLRKYKGFKDIQNEEFYQNIISDYNSLRQQYFSTIENIDIYLEIEELTARDQFARKIDDYINGRTDEDISIAMKGFQEATKNNDSIATIKFQKLLFPKPNKEYEKLQNELMRKVDSLNIDRLMDITKEHGWQERAWIILWHQRGNHDEDNYVWNYFRPLINKEIEEGKISRIFWSAFDQFKQRISVKMETIKVGENPNKKKEKK